MTASRWRAPKESGSTLVVPAWDELPKLVADNLELLRSSNIKIGDFTLTEARQLAEESLQQVAQHWEAWAGLAVTSLMRPLVITGHQPELYHPGVWAKNVALHQLGKKLGGSSLNLNVDSDIAKTTTLKVPVSGGEKPDVQLPYGPPQPPLPYEEWHCQDNAAFAHVAEVFSDSAKDWPWEPVFLEFWKLVEQQVKKTQVIPYRWLLARQQWERSHGITNHEFLMSQWCETPFFYWLLDLFVRDAVRFATVYNEELQRYRTEHRIRSVNHPVANLKVTDDLVELPFWVWQAGSTQRGRLCVKRGGGLVSLLAGKETPVSFQPAAHQEPRLINVPSAPQSQAFKIRPKALITSMMFRLFVADLFVHGIGGAVYDELTDRIFQRFWNVSLPRFAVITATLRLPWSTPPTDAEQPNRLRQTLRAMSWNPDRYLDGSESSAVAFLQEEKQRWIQNPVPVTQLAERHEQLEAIRTQLQPMVESKRVSTELQLQQTLQQLRWDEHHYSREYPWVLYPRDQLLSLRDAFP
jgi:hypothetical protein